MGDLIVGAAVALLALLCIRSLIKSHKAGGACASCGACSSCGGGCSCCSGCGSSPAKENEE